MNKLYLINDLYYVLAFDYYDAITIFQNYEKKYSEDIIQKIEIVSENVLIKSQINQNEEEDEEEY